MALQQITEGISGQQAAQIIYENDLENLEKFENYFPKGDTSAFLWGVTDAAGTLLLWFDTDLRLHTKLHAETYPMIDSDVFDWAVSDPKGNIIFGALTGGGYWPEMGAAPPAPPPEMGLVNLAEGRTMPTSVSRDGIWNQWISPLMVKDPEGSLWFCTVGTDSQLYVNKQNPYGAIQRRKLGDILSNLGSFKSDDHNAPAILIDPRPNADFPIMIYQVDHNTEPMRYWRFDSLDLTQWDVTTWQTIAGGNVAYSQPHRNGDEILVFSRRPDLPRPWRIARSADNGATFTAGVLFSAAASWLYMLTKPSADGSGIHLMCYGHPTNSADQNIYYLYLDLLTGAVRNPVTGVVIADFRAAIADSGFVPIDPFTAGLLVYEATGPELTRMWDFTQDGTDISLLFSSQPVPTRDKAGYESARYKVVNFDYTNGAVNFETDLGRSGYDIGEVSYFAGGVLVSPSRAVLCEWTPKGILDGGLNIAGNVGLTDVRLADFTDPNAPQVSPILQSDVKVIRPQVTPDGDKLALVEAQYFNSYDDFYASVLVHSVNDLIK